MILDVNRDWRACVITHDTVRVFHQRGLKIMNKLLSTLIGATLGALALTASAQTPSSPVAPAAQSQNPAAAATTTATTRKVTKAKHHKHKKVAMKTAVVK